MSLVDAPHDDHDEHDQHEHDHGTEADWQERLRAAGHRLTPQRQQVLAAIESLGHGTPEEVHGEVQRQAPEVNLSTVYRTLPLLEELGLIHHTHIEDKAPTYHATHGAEHFHLVCHTCRSVVSLPPEQIAGFTSAVLEEHGFRVDVGHLTVFGTCAACAAAEDDADAAPGESTPSAGR